MLRLLYLHNERPDPQLANLVQVLHMCKAFSALQVDVTLALAEPADKHVDPWTILAGHIGNKRSFDVKFYPKVGVGGRLNILGSYVGIRRLLRNSSADLCYVRDPLFFDLAIRGGFPTVFESHNARLHNRSRVLDSLWRRRLLRDMRSQQFLFLVPISQALAEVWISGGVSREKCLPLHDGFDEDLFSSTHSMASARAILGLPPDRKIVVYTGSLYPDRGIEAILQLAHREPDVLFVAVGGPQHEATSFRDSAAREGLSNLQFVGRAPHTKIPIYLAAADVLLMLWSDRVPTINYCSPLKVFEYMAAGRIIVGPGYPTIREVLTDGTTAFLADPRSFEHLAAQLHKALAHSYPCAIADRARSLAFAQYTWRHRAKCILEAYYHTATSGAKTPVGAGHST